MKSKMHRGSAPKQKQGKNVKRDEFDVTSGAPFAKFVKKKYFQSSQMSGTFIKKSKNGRSFKLNNRNKSAFVPEDEINSALRRKIQEKPKKSKLFSEILTGSVAKVSNLPKQKVLDNEKIEFNWTSTHRSSNKMSDSVIPVATGKAIPIGLQTELYDHRVHDRSSVKQAKAVRKENFNVVNNDKYKKQTRELPLLKQKSGKDHHKNPQTEVAVHDEQVLGSKRMHKKKKVKGGLQGVPEKRTLISLEESAAQNEYVKNQEHKKKKKHKHSLVASIVGDEISSYTVNSTALPKDAKHDDPMANNFSIKKKKKRSFSEKSDELVADKLLSGDDIADTLIQQKKKHKMNSERPMDMTDKEVVIRKTKKGISKLKKKTLQQTDMSQGNGNVSKIKSEEIESMTSEIPVIANNKGKSQDKREKRKGGSFVEDSDVVNDSVESCAGPSICCENFKLDYGSSENKKQKKKCKKYLESSFDDVMQDSSSGVLYTVKSKKSKEQLEAASPKSESDFIKLSQNKLCGFEGRADTPERLNRTVFVGNLPLSFNRKLLHTLFQNFGKIESVRLRSAVPARSTVPKKVAVIRKEFHSGSNSFNGYVVFKKLEDVDKALALNKTVVQGHHIRVDRFKLSNVYDNKHSVFVGNLPYSVTDENLWKVFGECGSIEAVRVVRDPGTGIGKGFGFILFENSDSVEKALLLNETEVNGRSIRVKIVEKGNKVKGSAPVENQRPKLNIGKKSVRKSGWRLAGQKKTRKKLMKKKMDRKKKKHIASILTCK